MSPLLNVKVALVCGVRHYIEVRVIFAIVMLCLPTVASAEGFMLAGRGLIAHDGQNESSGLGVMLGLRPISIIDVAITYDKTSSSEMEFEEKSFGLEAKLLPPIPMPLNLYVVAAVARSSGGSTNPFSTTSFSRNIASVGLGLEKRLGLVAVGADARYRMEASKIDIAPSELEGSGVVGMAYAGILF